MEKPKIGFIGTGIMGKPMAKNLIDAGYKLVVYDINQDAVTELMNYGAETANSPKEVAQKAEVIITMLPDSFQVKEVALGDKGLIEGVKNDQIYIDMSSIEPLIAKKVAEKLGEKGVKTLDAPVSGGQQGAIEGTLTIMVGGPEEVFGQCREIFGVLGKSAVRMGEIGSGQITKLLNQIIVAINIAAMSEAFILGKKAEVDPRNIYTAIRGGLAGSNVLDAKVHLVMDRKFEPGFRIDLHIKDLCNALNTGHELNVPLPLTSLVMEMMQALKVEGCGHLDHGALALFYEKMANIKIE
ncbi:2-hydroxy-3-oxopropionate reductase [Candidatus Aerophobetes bacterium]|uniref:2-hydroxy-3-oxopropionate reductase n=1 Tax=Aerophobetes bacterium TaxID=2030807 RepID=A0A523RRM0_UNCAE|nr:MAG: 2-hydroxy-3-oxopropionate reductase [Candidatus Aerophobetes bacterium]